MKIKSTFFRYLFSYCLLLLTICCCFLYISRRQLTTIFSTQLSSDIENRISLVQDTFLDNLETIYTINYHISSDKTLENYHISPNKYSRQKLYDTLKAFDNSNSFIGSITFVNKKNNDFFSTNLNIVKYENGICYIYVSDKEILTFNLSEAEKQGKNFLFMLSPSHLIIVPSGTNPLYSIFYSVNLHSLLSTINNNKINGIASFALIDAKNGQTFGSNTNLLPPIDSLPAQTGIYTLDEQTTLHIHTNIYDQLSLVVLRSNKLLHPNLQNALSLSNIFLLLIGILGCILIYFCMNVTFLPLYKLTQKVTQTFKPSPDYLQQLSSKFESITTEQQLLQEKINKYHVSIQKSLLDSVISSNNRISLSLFKNIDDLFHSDKPNHLYMIKIGFIGSTFSDSDIHQLFHIMLPAGSGSITFESKKDFRIYLINCITSEETNADVISMLMNALHKDYGFFCAISNPVSSLTEIPSLYENVLLASQQWQSDTPVVIYSPALALEAQTAYPYKLLQVFCKHLNNLKLSDATKVLNELYLLFDQMFSDNSVYPEYIIRSLLLDILTTIISFLNQNKVPYDIYKETYLETMYYCRNGKWLDNKMIITNNLSLLFELFQSEQNSLHRYQIQEYLESHFSYEDISLNTLADHFSVSTVYMSSLFKKEFQINFIDYLWNLRFKKASELLLQTNISVDTISKLVGYTNPSSFRRKFKQETGISPSQFRNQEMI